MVCLDYGFKKIIIDTTGYNLIPFGLSSSHFNPTTSELFFFVQPQDYKRVTNGDGTKFIATSLGRQIAIGLFETGFEVSLNEPSANLIASLSFLAEQSLLTGQLLNLKDYVRPSPIDYNNYTLRSGLIVSLRDFEGSLTVFSPGVSSYFPAGCGFVFINLNSSVI